MSATPPAPAPTRREPTAHRLVSGGVLLVAMLGLGFVAFNNPVDQAVLPRCPTEQFLGVYCPGCGATRATHHLLQGRPGTSWGYNPLFVVLGVPLIVWTLVALACHACTGRRFRRMRLPAAVGWGVLVLMLGYSVARNLPGERFEPLRPSAVEPGHDG
jgi:hypothetical protein